MDTIANMEEKVLAGGNITYDEAISLVSCNTDSLCESANKIRHFFCGDKFDFCSIINGKSGKCSEDCKYCAQSVHYKTEADIYDMIDKHVGQEAAHRNHNAGIGRFSIVTSGKKLTSEEVGKVCEIYSHIAGNCNIFLCASHGLLSFKDFEALYNVGVRRYHNNLETSRGFFPKICTTHTFDEKIESIKNAKKAGLEICSGGIIGLGETIEDRLSMAFTLRDLGVDSVPINIFNPIKGTPLEKNTPLKDKEIYKTIALFRFILPKIFIRLAGGRGLLVDKGKKCFLSGANGAISGDMLTTAGISVESDKKLIQELGYLRTNI